LRSRRSVRTTCKAACSDLRGKSWASTELSR
jgi:hypothetical protein